MIEAFDGYPAAEKQAAPWFVRLGALLLLAGLWLLLMSPFAAYYLLR